MSLEKNFGNKSAKNVSRAAEEQHLQETLSVIDHNIKTYGAEVSRMREEIDDMLEHFHDDNAELINTLENAITMHDHLKRALDRNEKAFRKPYFGRIDFHDLSLDKEESVYIGKGGILKDATNIAVVDWRAPVANAYYENGLGRCQYPSPEGQPIEIELQLKRTYEIEDSKLIDFFDTEVISNDDLLTKYLSKNKEAVLGEIVATIQKEQNDIIRRSPYHNCIVQGVAGSGKTTVAMHRISYILYNYPDRFKPDDFYIVGSNRILLNYITGVLPDLDVYGVRQMTMEQLFIRLLYEDWDDKKYSTKPVKQHDLREAVKGSLSWFEDLERYCSQLELDMISRAHVYLKEKGHVLLMDGNSVEIYLQQNPNASIQTKINTLNERLLIKVEDEFLGKHIKYTEQEKKQIRKAYKGWYGAHVWRHSIYQMYRDFLRLQRFRGYEVEVPETQFDVYDLAALAYLYKRVKETEVISEAHHVVIDEAQDYGMMAYSVLKFCIKDCTYTIMGDISQNIQFGFGLGDWEALKRLYMSTDRAGFDVLKKSYRNTIEISNFATKILKHGSFSMYPVEPIIRHGKDVEILDMSEQWNAGKSDDVKEADSCKNIHRDKKNTKFNGDNCHSDSKTNVEIKFEAMIEAAANKCKAWQKDGLETIAVICRDLKEAKQVTEALEKYIPLTVNNPEEMDFGKGVMVLPVEYTKGLEFDAVLIYNPTAKAYPLDDGHAKLLYVAATRALHELCVVHAGDLTELLTKPVVGDLTELVAGDLSPDVNAAASKEDVETENRSGTTVNNTISGEIKKTKLIFGEGNKAKATIRPQDMYTQVNKSNQSDNTNSYVKPAIAAKPSATKNVTGTAFGDIPPTSLLAPSGQAQADWAIKWIDKQKDGLYLHSRDGVLRISPVHSQAIRLTFAKGSQLDSGSHPKIRLQKPNRSCRFRDSAKVLEIMNDELLLQIEKATGTIHYFNRDKKLLVEEALKPLRQFVVNPKGMQQYRYHLKLQKGEKIFAHRIAGKISDDLKSRAVYISNPAAIDDLPLLVSEKGYGIMMATEQNAFFCDIAAYGTYLYGENEKNIDFYFITGKDTEEILRVYEELLGR